MKQPFKFLIPILTILLFNSCLTSQQVVNTVIALTVLDNICVTNVSNQIVQPATGKQQLIQFEAVLTNSSGTDGKGSLLLYMGVSAVGLGLNGGVESLTAQGPVPYYETPVTTVYPANTFTAYTSPVLVSMPYSPSGIYTITIHKWLVGQTGWDGSSCHTFTVTKQFN